MGRNRSKENSHYPQHVHPKNNALYFVRDKVWTRLGPVGMEECALHLAIAKATGAKVGEAPKPAGADALSMVEFIGRALPVVCQTVTAGTARNYGYYAKQLQAIFPKVGVAELEAADIYELRRKLAKHPASFNHLLSLLRCMMAWAVEKRLVKTNPCFDIKPLTTHSRKRYMSADEFNAIWAHANPRTRVIMELCYFTGQRIRDVLRLEERNLLDAGVLFVPSKTRKHSKQVIVAWSPELRAAVARARALRGDAVRFQSAEQYAAAVGREPMVEGLLLPGRGGRKPIAYQSVWDAWRRAVDKSGIENVRIHDLRARALSDVEQQQGMVVANQLGLHSTMQQTGSYVRHMIPKVVQGPSAARPKAPAEHE